MNKYSVYRMGLQRKIKKGKEDKERECELGSEGKKRRMRTRSPRQVYYPHSTAVKSVIKILGTWEENLHTPDISMLS